MISWFVSAVLRADSCLCAQESSWQARGPCGKLLIKYKPAQYKAKALTTVLSLPLPTLCPFPGLRKELHSTELETFTFLLGKRPVGCSRPLCSCPALTCHPRPPKPGHSLWTWRAVLAWWAHLSFAVKGTKRRSQPSPFPTAPTLSPPLPRLSPYTLWAWGHA